MQEGPRRCSPHHQGEPGSEHRVLPSLHTYHTTRHRQGPTPQLTGEWSTAQTRPALTGRRGRVVLSPSLRRPLLLHHTPRLSSRSTNRDIAPPQPPGLFCDPRVLLLASALRGGGLHPGLHVVNRAAQSGRALLPGVLPPGLPPPPLACPRPWLSTTTTTPPHTPR